MTKVEIAIDIVKSTGINKSSVSCDDIIPTFSDRYLRPITTTNEAREHYYDDVNCVKSRFKALSDGEYTTPFQETRMRLKLLYSKMASPLRKSHLFEVVAMNFDQQSRLLYNSWEGGDNMVALSVVSFTFEVFESLHGVI